MSKYPYMWRLLFPALLLLGVFFSCRRLPNVQGEGSSILQGVWNQDSVQNANQLLNYTQHKFKFTCDSFYVDMITHSKANYYADSCFNNGVWKEYAKGVYQVRSDSVFLTGTFTKANYKQKISGCYQIGQYIKIFKIKLADTGRLLLEGTDNQREVDLRLVEKIICTPQSL
ncbi:fumarate hydratase [Pedobacter steynii]